MNNAIQKTRRNWTFEETVVALYLYFTIPFQRVNKFNSIIQEYCQLLSRTPSALVMKIGNIGRLDPTLIMQNITGLSNGSKLDEEVWNAYLGKWDKLVADFEKVIQNLQKVPDIQDEPVCTFPEGKERVAQVSVRTNQNFFRQSVLAAYNNKCCITGIDIPELLVASHIKPWKEDLDNRLNPRNGLCLNNLHDKAFDRGFITFDDEFRLILSSHLTCSKDVLPFFIPYENKVISLPNRLSPDLRFLDFHRKNIFKE